MANQALSRKSVLKRSHRILDRALRVEHALDAVQRADQLARNPQLLCDADVERWKDAWIAAYLRLYRIAKQRGAL
jgi:hypothetical protein